VQRELSDEQKQRRVVLKRVNLDNAGVRSNFLRSGTMARGAAETGKVWATPLTQKLCWSQHRSCWLDAETPLPVSSSMVRTCKSFEACLASER